MISRRHIRLKVLQSLYAFHSKKEKNISKDTNTIRLTINPKENLLNKYI